MLPLLNWRAIPVVLVLAALLSAPSTCPGGGGGGANLSSIHQHVLDRTGYGPDEWSWNRISSLGVIPYVEEQLDPASIDDSAYQAIVDAIPSFTMSWRDLPDPQATTTPWRLLRFVKLRRTVISRRQLEAVLTDFWFDHFNIYAADDAWATKSIIPYERDAIAPHVLGNFQDMVLAVAKSPGMLQYLDNHFSSAGNLNENYARELMELHTLGVDEGYTQADVIDVARCFTGWKLDLLGTSADGFLFEPTEHDTGAKTVMTLDIPAGGGIEDGEAVVAFLANHPTTAQRIARLLVERFVNENAPGGLVADAATVFLASNGDLEAVMRTILHSDQFRHPQHRRAKVKRPLHFVGSMTRATRGDDEVQIGFHGDPGMGEALFRAHPPTGYPDDSAHWLSAGRLLERFQKALSLNQNFGSMGISWADVENGTPEEIVAGVEARLIPAGLTAASRDPIVTHLATYFPVGGPLAAKRAMLLILMTPEFMLH